MQNTDVEEDSAGPSPENACGPEIDRATCQADAEALPAGIEREIHAAGLGTFDSFRIRDFRLFWSGAALSNIGTWMQMAALGWVVYTLTRDELALGLVNFVSGIPTLFLVLFAGAAADHMDRRRLLIWMQWAMLAQAGALGVLTYTHRITMPWIYILSAIGGIFTAFMFPAWQATIPDIVPRRLLLNAISLNATQFNGARLVGPLITGALFLAFGRDVTNGAAAVFCLNAVSFLFVIWALAIIRPNQVRAERGESALKTLGAGLGYVRQNGNVAMLLVTQACITLFGMPFTALLPALAAETLGRSAVGYSTLLAANGGGALAGSLVMASLKPGVRRERIIAYGVPLMGLLLVGVALSRSYYLTMVVFFVVGFVFLSAVSSVNTSIQAIVPPQLRGRVMSLFVLSFMGIMPIGALVFGAIGRQTSAALAIGIGAAVLTGYGVVLAFRPRLIAVDER